MSILRIIIISIVILSYNFAEGQCLTKNYHQYSIDGSYPVIEKWNIKDTINLNYLIEETFDTLKRVVSIKFLYKGKIKEIYPMYGVSYITFEYQKSIIIERYFNFKGYPLTLFEDESPSYRIYYLDSNNIIDSCNSFYYIDVGKLTINNLKKIDDNVSIWKDVIYQEPIDTTNENNLSSSNCDMNYVYGFSYSYFKMQGYFPKIKDYKFSFEDFRFIYTKNIFDKFIKKYR